MRDIRIVPVNQVELIASQGKQFHVGIVRKIETLDLKLSSSQ